MRFRSDWTRASTEPTSTDAVASTQMMGRQLATSVGNASMSTRTKAAKPPALATAAM